MCVWVYFVCFFIIFFLFTSRYGSDADGEDVRELLEVGGDELHVGHLGDAMEVVDHADFVAVLCVYVCIYVCMYIYEAAGGLIEEADAFSPSPRQIKTHTHTHTHTHT